MGKHHQDRQEIGRSRIRRLSVESALELALETGCRMVLARVAGESCIYCLQIQVEMVQCEYLDLQKELAVELTWWHWMV